MLATLAACGASATQSARDALAPVTVAADAAYEALVVECDAHERAIVDMVQPGDDFERVKARLEHVRGPCRAAAHAFEAFREAQQAALTAAEAADTCPAALEGTCMNKAIATLGHAIQAAALARRAHRIAKTAMEHPR